MTLTFIFDCQSFIKPSLRNILIDFKEVITQQFRYLQNIGTSWGWEREVDWEVH